MGFGLWGDKTASTVPLGFFMSSDALTERESLVLHALIKAHIATGNPIGSHAIGRQEDLGVSTATIRSTLASLEKKGFLAQPHTSAGRLPTEKAYRFYVAFNLAAGREESAEDEAWFREALEARICEGHLDEITAQLAEVIGDVSCQLGVVMAPRFEQGVFQKLELIALSSRRLLLVLSVEMGPVKSLVIEVEVQVSQPEIDGTSRLLNERLYGLSLAEIRRTGRQRLDSIQGGHPQLLRLVTAEIEELTGPVIPQLHVAGASNICRQPEFSDPTKMAALMDVVEKKASLAQLLEDRQGVVVTIGDENGLIEMRLCSIVTASYTLDGGTGIIGVIGPMRMPYRRVVGLVDYVANRAIHLMA